MSDAISSGGARAHVRSSALGRRLLAIGAACACACVLTPGAAHAGPAWARVGPAGIAPGLRVADRVVPVMHQGQWLLAMRESRDGRDLLIVNRYDRELGAWLPVGGPLNRTITGSPPKDVRMLSVGDDLYVSWVEHRDGGPIAVVARLEETPSGSVRWRAVGDVMPGSRDRALSPSLVQARGDLWLVWLGVDDRVRLARLDDGAWQTIDVAIGGRGVSDPQAVNYDGDIYVGVRDQEETRGNLHDDDNIPWPLVLRDSARVARLSLGGAAPRLTEMARFSAPDADLNDGVDGFQLWATRDAAPLIAWRSRRRSTLRIARLSGGGLVRLAQVERFVEATPFLLSQVRDTIVVAAPIAVDGGGLATIGSLLVFRFDSGDGGPRGVDHHVLSTAGALVAMAPDHRQEGLMFTVTTLTGNAVALSYSP